MSGDAVLRRLRPVSTEASNTVTIAAPAGTFSVSYDGNTNTGGTAPVDGSSPYDDGASVTVLGEGDLVKTGFSFDGWNTADDGSGTGYVESDTFTISADTTLYAQWVADVPAPLVENVVLSSSPTGGGDVGDDLSCASHLAGSASTSATKFTRDGVHFATLVLPMEGGATVALDDISGNNLGTATMNGDPTWSATAGHDGNGAFVFDGNDDLDVGEVFPGGSYTKSAWVYRTGSGASGGNNIISGDVNDGGHALWARESNGFRLSAGHDGAWFAVQDSVARCRLENGSMSRSRGTRPPTRWCFTRTVLWSIRRQYRQG